MSEPNKDQMALIAKAQAAGPPSREISPDTSYRNHTKQSWRDAAKSVQLNPRDYPYPNLHDFEKSIFPSLRTLNTQFSCELCPHCKHPIISSVFQSAHLEDCKTRQAQTVQAQVKKEEIVGDSNTNGAVNDKSSEANADAASSSAPKRKRKQTKDDDDGQNKKAKTGAAKNKEPKKTGSKPRQPKKEKVPKEKPAKEKASAVYNPDRNCGVPLPNGHPCMRSLTCKQHPMGAKRAVAARSAPYDVLLSNYHRQHQMKQAQLTANAAQAAQLKSDQQQELEAQQNPEREVSQVFDGVSRAIFAPLAVSDSLVSTPLRVGRFRMREMLSSALLPRRTPPTGSLLYGRSLAFKDNSPEVLYNMRSQAVQQAVQIRQRWQQKQRQQQMLQQMKGAEAGK